MQIIQFIRWIFELNSTLQRWFFAKSVSNMFNSFNNQINIVNVAKNQPIKFKWNDYESTRYRHQCDQPIDDGDDEESCIWEND